MDGLLILKSNEQQMIAGSYYLYFRVGLQSDIVARASAPEFTLNQHSAMRIEFRLDESRGANQP